MIAVVVDTSDQLKTRMTGTTETDMAVPEEDTEIRDVTTDSTSVEATTSDPVRTTRVFMTSNN